MELKIFRRHSADCPDKADRYAPRCGCPLWGEFNWPQSQTTLDGKRLRQGQNKWTLKTRTKAEALRHAAKLENDLEALLEGKPVRQKSITVEAAVQEWLTFRSMNELTNTKPKFMANKLVDWCKKNEVLLLSAITPDQAIKFRMSLPFRTGDSSSLSVHWAVIGGFFNWAVGMGYIPANPIPDTRRNPQFRIRYEKQEVVPPTKKQVEKVLATATGRVKLFCELMRWTAMALVDAQKFGMALEDTQNFGLSKPERRPVLENETLIRGRRTKTNERYRVRISRSLAEQLQGLGSPAFPGAESMWRERVKKVFRDAGVIMTPHGFRHYRISESLAQGFQPSDVSKWVGASEKEIRKTYEHWIREAEDRLDTLQRQSWIAQGLDENGDAKEHQIQ
jgi:integrase